MLRFGFKARTVAWFEIRGSAKTCIPSETLPDLPESLPRNSCPPKQLKRVQGKHRRFIRNHPRRVLVALNLRCHQRRVRETMTDRAPIRLVPPAAGAAATTPVFR